MDAQWGLELKSLYQRIKLLREENRVPALDRCLADALMNLHWALWLTGQDEEWLPWEPTLPATLAEPSEASAGPNVEAGEGR